MDLNHPLPSRIYSVSSSVAPPLLAYQNATLGFPCRFRSALMFPAMLASGVGTRQLDQKSPKTYPDLEDRKCASFLMDSRLPHSSSVHPRQERDMDVLFVTPEILEESFV
ncbi:hypothetical protein EVG20_g6708 [Dentipellis fragilis]|uniref:Uncharacterized protein n=1 Tax=Dentipellis fragilis TaxID=205917 RepID=A0A4Y9YIS0_9AGAM|nr:hypothetical protein EVG20_g6708 [Dentipellis fragilis]